MTIIINRGIDFFTIRKMYVIQKSIGTIIMSIPVVTFILFLAHHPSRMGHNPELRIFSIAFIFFLIFILSREYYFFYIDKTRFLSKSGDKFIINSHEYFISGIISILIIRYNGIGIMEDGYNIYLKMKTEKIPISIRISQKDMEEVKCALISLLNVSNIKEKKWIIS